ncbi:MAG: NlpC/P60 family protein [bacterium]
MIVSYARKWLGTPYRHQASEIEAGADCLGLVRGIWRDLYGQEAQKPPPYTPDWIERHGDEPLLAAAQKYLIPAPGDPLKPAQVLLFRVMLTGPVKHMGIITEPDRFIHAYAGRAVVESWLSRWWQERLVQNYEFPGVDDL